MDNGKVPTRFRPLTTSALTASFHHTKTPQSPNILHNGARVSDHTAQPKGPCIAYTIDAFPALQVTPAQPQGCEPLCQPDRLDQPSPAVAWYKSTSAARSTMSHPGYAALLFTMQLAAHADALGGYTSVSDAGTVPVSWLPAKVRLAATRALYDGGTVPRRLLLPMLRYVRWTRVDNWGGNVPEKASPDRSSRLWVRAEQRRGRRKCDDKWEIETTREGVRHGGQWVRQ